jgi:hypothetical protein
MSKGGHVNTYGVDLMAGAVGGGTRRSSRRDDESAHLLSPVS